MRLMQGEKMKIEADEDELKDGHLLDLIYIRWIVGWARLWLWTSYNIIVTCA